MPNLLGLPTELLHQILRYVVEDCQQATTTFCTCNTPQSDIFHTLVTQEDDYGDPRLDLTLVNKAFAILTRSFALKTVTAFVCSETCLRRFLKQMRLHERLGRRVHEIRVMECRKPPVKVRGCVTMGQTEATTQKQLSSLWLACNRTWRPGAFGVINGYYQHPTQKLQGCGEVIVLHLILERRDRWGGSYHN